jgi:hypothetical protein
MMQRIGAVIIANVLLLLVCAAGGSVRGLLRNSLQEVPAQDGSVQLASPGSA